MSKKWKKFDFEYLSTSENIAEKMPAEQLKMIGQRIREQFDRDDNSRQEWKERQRDSNRLALQVVQEKHYPWPNSSNVKFPLLTIASMQFSARAYPALIKGPNLVHYRSVGRDQDGSKSARAMRVAKFMSWQLLEEDENWEENQDKLFMVLPIVGCAFKKTFYDPVKNRNCSTIVLPQDLVVNYYARSIEDCERKTEVFQLFDREIKERQLRGVFLDVELNVRAANDPKATDERQGIQPPTPTTDDPRNILECHCYWDFDGDGYEEPYVITVDKDTSKVLRIVNRFGKITTKQSLEIERINKQKFLLAQTVQPPNPNQPPTSQQVMAIRNVEVQLRAMDEKLKALAEQKPEIFRIEADEYYTKYSFIPAPDGGFYDLGFGALLGPLNESVNTIINQLIDSGTLQNGSQGFIGKGARIQGGKLRFEPYEWKRVNVAGSALKDSIVPLPVNDPSPTLFQLLSLLINYSERTSSVTDVMSGQNPGQNTPAYNMASMLEQGLQVFNGVFKRIYRSFRAELRKHYRLNSKFLSQEMYVTTIDGDIQVLREDFTGDEKDLIPAADPNAFSNMENLMKAQFLSERAATAPGYNPIAVEKRLLEGMNIPDLQEIYPLDEQGNWVIPPPPNPELELEKAKEQRELLTAQAETNIKAAIADADIALKEAQAIKALADAGAVEGEGMARQAELILEAFKIDKESVEKSRELDIRQVEAEAKKKQAEKPNAASNKSGS